MTCIQLYGKAGVVVQLQPLSLTQGMCALHATQIEHGNKTFCRRLLGSKWIHLLEIQDCAIGKAHPNTASYIADDAHPGPPLPGSF